MYKDKENLADYVSKILREKKQKKNMHNFKKIYIVSNIQGGGSKKYLDNLTTHYTNTTFIYIKNRLQLLNIVFLPCDILFVQHLLYTDIFPEDLNAVKHKYNVKTIISIHDFYWFISDINHLLHELSSNPYYEYIYLHPPACIHPSILTLFDNASMVIHPSSFTKLHFDKFFRKDNTIVQPHNDIEIDYTVKQIPLVNNQINIAHFQPFTKYKGSNFVFLLQQKYKIYKKYNIKFLILGKNISAYTETNWYETMKEHHVHCLLHLNKYGETYSYALTKSINSGLPILYNNIGAYQERIPNNPHYIKVYNSENEMNNYDLLYTQFEKMLDYIIEHQGTYHTFNSTTTIKYNELYNYILDDTLELSINSILHSKIKPFAIYFPQFHAVPENNKNYYHGMTDIHQLKCYIEKYKKIDEIKDTPSLSELDINTMLDYTLTNKKIIKKQIDIARKFSFYGFACYYYWFSDNSITNQHTIFENCYNLFFEEPIDFKIYFIWANENWSNNPSFNVTTEKIINIYTFDNCMKNITNLITYFKHANYYKINNKPLFAIHHPWYMSDKELSVFNYILDTECSKHGFDGVILLVNNKTYTFLPSYREKQFTDYYEYIDKFVKLPHISINTLFFNFNNSARFSNPYRKEYTFKIKNTTIYNQDCLTHTILKSYKTTHLEEDSIVLINSWNEWGEDMAIEPGEINKTKYLSLIKSNLLSFLCN